MKRFVSLLLAVLLLLSLCACGGSQEPSSTESSSSVITASESASNDSVVSSLYSMLTGEDTEITDRIVVGLSNSDSFIYRGSSILLGKSFEVGRDCDGDTLEEYFRVGLDTPNGLKVLAAVENRGSNLAVNFTLNAAFDESRDIREDYYIQLSFLDLDGDGDEDLLVTAGNLSDLSETLFYKLEGGTFEFCGSVMSGAKLRYDGECFTTTDNLTYVFTDTLKSSGENGLEDVPVEITDEALRATFASLVRPLVITVPDSFSMPSQVPKDKLLLCALFGYIVNTTPETRTYDETDVLISESDAAAQLALLFGDAVTLNPSDYPQREDSFVYYDREAGAYRMPSFGYYSDELRVDQLEMAGEGYVMTASHIPVDYGETGLPLEERDASRVVKYTFVRQNNSWVVASLEVVEQY